MKVIINIPNETHASDLMAKGYFYILRDRVDKYVNENNIIEEKINIYEYLIKELKKDINK